RPRSDVAIYFVNVERIIHLERTDRTATLRARVVDDHGVVRAGRGVQRDVDVKAALDGIVEHLERRAVGPVDALPVRLKHERQWDIAIRAIEKPQPAFVGYPVPIESRRRKNAVRRAGPQGIRPALRRSPLTGNAV